MTRRTWSQGRVVEAIHARQRQGLPISTIYCDDIRLYAAGKHYYGSWNQALQAAGLPPHKKRWSRRAVIKAILARRRHGLPLHGITRDDYLLGAAARRYFGSWSQALEAANQPPLPPHPWTPERVIEAIRGRQRRGLSLSTVWREDRVLYSAGIRYYGSWRDALRAAGFPTRARKKWSKEAILQELRARYRPGVAHIRFWAEHSQLARAASRYFGGKYRALVHAGLCREKPEPSRRWSPQEVIDAIRTRRRQGLSLKAVWREDLRLYSSAKRLFGSWCGAMRAAGIDPQLPRRWSREDVIDAIHSRRQEGLPLKGGGRAFPSLFAAAKKHFGNWHHAMLAAGLESAPRKRWTREIIIAAIDEHHRQGTLSHVWRDDKTLFSAGCKRFGSWQNALAAAGLTPRRLRRWSKERILRELRRWHGQAQHAVRLQDPALAGAAARFFGSVQSAAKAAGIELRQRKWTPQRVVEAIQDRYVEGRPIAIAGFGEVSLATIAKHRFGSWREAVTAAGLAHTLPEPRIVRTWSKEAVLEAVLTRHRQGLRLTQVWADDTGLYSVAKKHFGTWSNTLRAAGLPPTRKQWTKDLVVEEIQAWHRQGVAISSISRQDMRLTVTAIRLFGNWHRALRAAGFKPPPKRRRTANGRQEKLTRPRNRKDVFPITKKGCDRCRAKPLSAASSSARRRNAG